MPAAAPMRADTAREPARGEAPEDRPRALRRRRPRTDARRRAQGAGGAARSGRLRHRDQHGRDRRRSLRVRHVRAADWSELVTSVDWPSLFSDQPPRRELSIRRKQRGRVLPDPARSSASATFRSAAVDGRAVRAESRAPAARPHVARRRRRQLRPACRFRSAPSRPDMVDGKPVVFDRGPLYVAMRASMSVPGVFAPVEVDGKILGDGGLVNNLPVDVVKAMGAEVVIAVNIGTPLMTREQLSSFVGIAEQIDQHPDRAERARAARAADPARRADRAGPGRAHRRWISRRARGSSRSARRRRARPRTRCSPVLAAAGGLRRVPRSSLRRPPLAADPAARRSSASTAPRSTNPEVLQAQVGRRAGGEGRSARRRRTRHRACSTAAATSSGSTTGSSRTRGQRGIEFVASEKAVGTELPAVRRRALDRHPGRDSSFGLRIGPHARLAQHARRAVAQRGRAGHGRALRDRALPAARRRPDAVRVRLCAASAPRRAISSAAAARSPSTRCSPNARRRPRLRLRQLGRAARRARSTRISARTRPWRSRASRSSTTDAGARAARALGHPRQCVLPAPRRCARAVDAFYGGARSEEDGVDRSVTRLARDRRPRRRSRWANATLRQRRRARRPRPAVDDPSLVNPTTCSADSSTSPDCATGSSQGSYLGFARAVYYHRIGSLPVIGGTYYAGGSLEVGNVWPAAARSLPSETSSRPAACSSPPTPSSVRSTSRTAARRGGDRRASTCCLGRPRVTTRA